MALVDPPGRMKSGPSTTRVDGTGREVQEIGSQRFASLSTRSWPFGFGRRLQACRTLRARP